MPLHASGAVSQFSTDRQNASQEKSKEMITRETIRELAAFQSPENCAITFYYQPPVAKDQSHREESILVKDLVRSALHDAEREGGKNQCARKDLQRILEVAEGLHGN